MNNNEKKIEEKRKRRVKDKGTHRKIK